MMNIHVLRLGLILAMAGTAAGQITRVATFENFSEGQLFSTSFTDPSSGITFRDSTNPPNGGFSIDYSATFFGGSTYLTAGGYSTGPVGGFGAYFGFTADLPTPADQVSVDIWYIADPKSNVTLRAYNALGALVAQQPGAVDAPDPFTLAIHSGQWDITRFQVVVGTGSAGYDNISYTVIPESTIALLPLIAAAVALRRARRSWKSS